MAEIVWTEPALSDLDASADYIALDNPIAAAALVQRVFYRHDAGRVFILFLMRSVWDIVPLEATAAGRLSRC